jgi:hypothetical protein
MRLIPDMHVMEEEEVEAWYEEEKQKLLDVYMEQLDQGNPWRRLPGSSATRWWKKSLPWRGWGMRWRTKSWKRSTWPCRR